MNIAAEFKAALPEPHTILGLRLLPLSLGRYRLLKRFNCPFVGDELIEMPLNKLVGELLFALIVCGLPCEEFKQLLDTGKIKKESERFGKYFRKYINRTVGFDVFVCIQQFKNYLAESIETPWHVVPTSTSQEGSASHWSHGMEVVLRSEVNWTQLEISEEPLTKAMVDYFKYMEGQGAVSLVSHEDFQEMELYGKQNAEILAQLGRDLNLEQN